MQRLRYGRNETAEDRKRKKPAVLLMHGLFCSAMEFVNTGPNKSLALILAEAGYDVWLGNNRGTTWSRNHVKLNPDIDPEFWEYSFETVGQYDLPAKIDYILEQTGHKKIIYIGQSQGTTQFFVMAALRPKYNEKIALMAALAPLVYVTHISSKLLRTIDNNLNKIEPILNKLGIFELFSHSSTISGLLSWLSSDGSPLQEIIVQLLFLICGFDNTHMDRSILPVVFSNAPAGISLQMATHLSQGAKSGSFRRYDYGEVINNEIYGSPVPPNFNLSAVTAPVALYYAKNDLMTNVKDVKKLAMDLPNVVKDELIGDKHFNHIDFFIAKSVKEILYNQLLELMNLYIYSEDSSPSPKNKRKKD